MAQRRMFSKKVCDTDNFLDMPHSAQNLYFHLGLRADDDGFVSNPKRIMKMINSSEDDMKILLAKKFLIPFDSGVCVLSHWRIHNYIQKDRYEETQYLEEKEKLLENNGKYELDTECIQNVSTGKVRLGKVTSEQSSRGKLSLEENEPPITEVELDSDGMTREVKPPKAPKLDEITPVFALWGKYPANWKLNKTQRQAAKNLLQERDLEVIKKALDFYNENKDNKFCPIINSPYDLDSKWASLASFKRKNEL